MQLKERRKTDVLILGAGAAGLMCAIEAGKRGKSVLIIERNAMPAEKIRISGGGRCNFTNINANAQHYLSENPHFCKSALAQFSANDFIAMVERHGIAYHEKKLGQLFCNSSSKEIIRMLLDECRTASVEIATGCTLSSIPEKLVEGFVAETSRGTVHTPTLVVATGGISIPKMGATDIGYRIAGKFGLNVIPSKPGLVPFVCNANDAKFCHELSGASIDCIVSCKKKSFREHLLFTHKGLSGPAILQISSYWNPGEVISIDCSPGQQLSEHFKDQHQTKKEMVTVLSELFPKRFARLWCDHYVPSKQMYQYSNKELNAIAHRLHNWEIVPAGTEGFGKAEVTCGGVDTAELSSKTMEAKKVNGLFFIGEVIDVTGELGGYNFQWAWASGAVAGRWV